MAYESNSINKAGGQMLRPAWATERHRKRERKERKEGKKKQNLISPAHTDILKSKGFFKTISPSEKCLR